MDVVSLYKRDIRSQKMGKSAKCCASLGGLSSVSLNPHKMPGMEAYNCNPSTGKAQPIPRPYWQATLDKPVSSKFSGRLFQKVRWIFFKKKERK